MSALNIFLGDVEESAALGVIPQETALRGYKRSRILRSSARVVERNAVLPYPNIRVEPRLMILLHEARVQAVLHAYVDIGSSERGLEPIVTVSLPFLCLGRKSQMTAVLAHEFLHYLSMAVKFLNSDFFTLQQRFSGTITGRLLFDEVDQTPPKKVFRGRYLREIVSERFHPTINDERLTSKIEEEWVERGLPTTILGSDDFAIRLSAEGFMSLIFPGEVLSRASQIMVDE